MAFGDVQVGDLTFPRDHQAGMKVPRGGSMCKNCRFLKDAENRICGEPNFIKWNGGEVIPGEIDAYCSDWYRPVSKHWGNVAER